MMPMNICVFKVCLWWEAPVIIRRRLGLLVSVRGQKGHWSVA